MSITHVLIAQCEFCCDAGLLVPAHMLHRAWLYHRSWRLYWFICAVQDVGVFQKKSEAKGVQEQLMANPDMMQNMMKQQLTGLVPQVRCFDSWCIQHKTVMQHRYFPHAAADCYGSFCKLFLFRLHHGQDPFPTVPFLPTHASGITVQF